MLRGAPASRPSEFIYPSLLKSCSDPRLGRFLHSLHPKSGLHDFTIVRAALLDSYSRFSNPKAALYLFDERLSEMWCLGRFLLPDTYSHATSLMGPPNRRHSLLVASRHRLFYDFDFLKLHKHDTVNSLSYLEGVWCCLLYEHLHGKASFMFDRLTVDAKEESLTENQGNHAGGLDVLIHILVALIVTDALPKTIYLYGFGGSCIFPTA